MKSEKRLIDANDVYSLFDINGFARVHVSDIDLIPRVDAVEVVRCKDCKHWKHFKHLGCTDFVKVCGLANYMIGENGYCMYGERIDDEDSRNPSV